MLIFYDIQSKLYRRNSKIYYRQSAKKQQLENA